MLTVYQAGPLFTEAEKDWHRKLGAALSGAGFKAVWPGDLLSDRDIAAAGNKAKSLIFQSCLKALAEADLVAALLDGPQVDDGTAWEIGFAFARSIPVHGLRTDSRRGGETACSSVNSMIECSLASLSGNIEELAGVLRTVYK